MPKYNNQQKSEIYANLRGHGNGDLLVFLANYILDKNPHEFSKVQERFEKLSLAKMRDIQKQLEAVVGDWMQGENVHDDIRYDYLESGQSDRETVDRLLEINRFANKDLLDMIQRKTAEEAQKNQAQHRPAPVLSRSAQVSPTAAPSPRVSATVEVATDFTRELRTKQSDHQRTPPDPRSNEFRPFQAKQTAFAFLLNPSIDTIAHAETMSKSTPERGGFARAGQKLRTAMARPDAQLYNELVQLVKEMQSANYSQESSAKFKAKLDEVLTTKPETTKMGMLCKNLSEIIVSVHPELDKTASKKTTLGKN